ADQNAGRAALPREDQAEHGNADRGDRDLRLAFELVGDTQEQERPDRVRDRDDEGVKQRARQIDALRDQELRHPARETVIADRLEQVEDHENDRAAEIGWPPYLEPGAGDALALARDILRRR